MKPLIIRADAGPQIGTGHVMRCLALAQAWEDAGGDAVFAMAAGAQSIEPRIEAERMKIARLSAQPGSIEDAAETIRLAREAGAKWIAVDGYVFGSDYQRAIKDAGFRLLFIDDYGHCHHYTADIVLNQNIYADESFYRSIEPYTRLLLGSKFVLLRREFLKWRGWKREILPVARKVLVTLGGSDPNNVAFKVIQALQEMDGPYLQAKVITGLYNAHPETLRQAEQCLRIQVQFVTDTTNMAELMAWADIAVSAGGTSCWEIAYMSLPNCIIVTAENQALVAEALHSRGVSVNMGWFASIKAVRLAQVLSDLLQDKEQRSYMSHQGRLIVQGEGSRNVVNTIRNKFMRDHDNEQER
jgi:UDP-2,4-diacetamido-2,4,6-trideoxy-beta-L-altropyranose hydrolase